MSSIRIFIFYFVVVVVVGTILIINLTTFTPGCSKKSILSTMLEKKKNLFAVLVFIYFYIFSWES